ncbi:membrane protein, PF01595 family [Eubacterium nodatum ATCC 33099]|nr:membrane protein, PF01595 family [Eubacterium nodatum ATCC 33099]
METRELGLYIGGMAFLIILSAYFSATETAFTSVNRIKLKNMAGDGNMRAKKVLLLEERYDTLLSTILVGNNIANIATTAIATVFFVNLYGRYGPTISTIVITVTVLIFGEISPKNLAKEYPEKFAMFSALLISLLMTVFTPINWIFAQWKKLLRLIFKVNLDKGITEEEIKTLVEEAATEGNIMSEQEELIQNAIDFSDLEAWDVLTPRVDIKAIEIDDIKEDVGMLFKDTGFSRMPVYEDDLDNILGVLNQKDFHNFISGTEKTIADYVKPVVFVAGSMKCADLLKKLQANKTQIAIVVDEYGGTEGLVTMEDIIEELVGEIYDEHDAVETEGIIPLRNGSFRVMGNTNVEKMFDYFDEEIDMSATTVNGWLILQIDKLPESGDEFEYDAGNKIFRGKVTKADSRKALEINLKVEEKQEEELQKAERGNK